MDLGIDLDSNHALRYPMERIPDKGAKFRPASPMPSIAQKRERFVSRAKIVVFVLAGIPFAALLIRAFQGDLGANPVEEITHVTGEWALRLLIVTLMITPLRHLIGAVWPTRLRRMLGLFAFFYLLLHFLTYAILDASLDPAYIVQDVIDRLYITAGFAAFLMLIPLAITSTNAMVRRMGPVRWRRLHRLVYPAAIAGALHFLWLVKADLGEPLIYASILALLLTARLPPLTRRLQALGNRRKTRLTTSKATPSKGRGDPVNT